MPNRSPRTRRLGLLLLGPLLLAPGCSHLVGPRANAGWELLEGPGSPVGGAAIAAKYAGWALGLPISIALSPIAGLLCATPWFDLQDAIDFASAPSLGLGYGVQALVALPAYGAARAFGAPATGVQPVADRQNTLVPWGFVVDHSPLSDEPRPAAPIGSETRARYAVSAREVARLSIAMREAERVHGGCGPLEVPLDLGFAATLEVYWADEPGRRPLLLMTPPTRATFASRWLAERYAERGIHVALMVPEDTFLDPALNPAQLEQKLRAAVISGRTALAALRGRPEIAHERLLYLGISAGAIYGSVMMALEPIQRSVLAFPGGDLPRIVTTSRERMVVDYREGRELVGQPPEILRAALADEIRTDPLQLAPHVDPSQVLVFLGADDTKVPIETGQALCRAMGGPETWTLSGDHASAAVCFGFVLEQADAFFNTN